MTPAEWLEFGKSFGVPILLLAAVGYFFVKNIWPFVMEQLKDARSEGKTERDQFMKALERRDCEFAKVIAHLDDINQTMMQLRDELKEHRRKA